MPAHEYDLGDRVRLTAVFTLDGAAIDPTETVFKVKTPTGVITEYDAVRDSEGHYHADVDVTESGTHAWRVEGTGAAQTAGESAFVGKRSEFA
jgi:hypothetical protein